MMMMICYELTLSVYKMALMGLMHALIGRYYWYCSDNNDRSFYAVALCVVDGRNGVAAGLNITL